MSPAAKARQRNPRGEGGRLREEILQATTRLIDGAGAETVTLRAVAREAGISAPSIYDHFADRDQILAAALQRFAAELTAEITAARDRYEDPVDRLEAGAEAYLRFAERRPQRYALLFRHARPAGAGFGEPDDQSTAAFRTLMDGIAHCVAAGRSHSTDTFGDAAALWAALHGYASLHPIKSNFPWPDHGDTMRRIVHGLAHIDG